MKNNAARNEAVNDIINEVFPILNVGNLFSLVVFMFNVITSIRIIVLLYPVYLYSLKVFFYRTYKRTFL